MFEERNRVLEEKVGPVENDEEDQDELSHPGSSKKLGASQTSIEKYLMKNLTKNDKEEGVVERRNIVVEEMDGPVVEKKDEDNVDETQQELSQP